METATALDHHSPPSHALTPSPEPKPLKAKSNLDLALIQTIRLISTLIIIQAWLMEVAEVQDGVRATLLWPDA